MVEPCQDGGLAQELLASLLADLIRQGAIVLHLLQRTEASFETSVVGEINGACAALSDPFPDLIAGMQQVAGLQSRRHFDCGSRGPRQDGSCRTAQPASASGRCRQPS